MNYFELFGLPVQFTTDGALLRKRYMELTRQYHPDYFVNKPAEEQEKALEISALLNKGLKTLQNPDQTLAYILELKGLVEKEEKYQLPPEFLMEMMEVNEALADADGQAERERVAGIISQWEKDIYAPVQTIIENYQDGTTTEEELLQVKEYYFKKKYLDRLRGQFDGMP